MPTKQTTKPKAAKPKDEEPTKDLAEKEARGRGGSDPHAGRDPRPFPPDPPSPDPEVEAAKTEWKEARNVHPLHPYEAHQPRPEPEEPEPPAEPTQEDIAAKEARGLTRVT